MSKLTVGNIEFNNTYEYNLLRKLADKLNKRNEAIAEVQKLVDRYNLDITRLEIDGLVDTIIKIMKEER